MLVGLGGSLEEAEPFRFLLFLFVLTTSVQYRTCHTSACPTPTCLEWVFLGEAMPGATLTDLET